MTTRRPERDSDGVTTTTSSPFGLQTLPPRPLTKEQRAALYDPLANARAALTYIQAHYRRPPRRWEWPTTSERSDHPQHTNTNAAGEPPRGPSRARARGAEGDGPPTPAEPGERLPGCREGCVPTASGLVVHALDCPNGVFRRKVREVTGE